jgi:hypothetical protein
MNNVRHSGESLFFSPCSWYWRKSTPSGNGSHKYLNFSSRNVKISGILLSLEWRDLDDLGRIIF